LVDSVEICDNIGISREEIQFELWFIRMCLDVRTAQSCEAILNSTSHSYSCKGRWLGGESSRRSYHNDDSRFLFRDRD